VRPLSTNRVSVKDTISPAAAAAFDSELVATALTLAPRRREQYDRYPPCRPLLVPGVAGVPGRDLDPQPLSLLRRCSVRRHGEFVLADVDQCTRIVLKVEPPIGRTIRAAVRRDHDEIVPIAEERQRRRSRLARPTAGRRQQEHRHPGQRAE